MNESLEKKLARLLKKSERRKAWRVIVMTLAVVVAFSTFHFLIISAITMEKEPVCGIEEHTHGPECYREDKVLICGQEESSDHKHTDKCYKVEKVLVCKKKEHVHTAECYKHADINADNETVSEWEDSFSLAKVNGNWNEDIVSIARTQLGYEESSKNYVRNEKGKKLGYTRYGDWYGNQYGGWDDMFVSFCMNYAQIPEKAIPFKNDTTLWMNKMKKDGAFEEAGEKAPESGDIVFFDTDSDGKTERVGIVESVEKQEDTGRSKITTIEGDVKNKVQEKEYKLKDPDILGFGKTAKAQSRYNAPKMVTKKTESGNYWVPVKANELSSGETYIIVSVEGNCGLKNTSGSSSASNTVPVLLTPVKGNPGYYKIPNVPSSIKFSYSYQSNKKSFINIGTDYALDLTYRPKLFRSSQDAKTLNIADSDTRACCKISNGKYYLNNDGSKFSADKKQYLRQNDDYYQYDQTSDMIILKQVNATLTIPNDAVFKPAGNNQGTATKPNYDPYIDPSGEKTGSYSYNSEIQGTYASDPSTSQIESLFGYHTVAEGQTDFEAQNVDNGKAITDKSVVYGCDDYDAFKSSYDDGVFSVTLSALGQAFEAQTSEVKIPIDVLYILDMSNSMNKSDSGVNKTRAQVLVDTINTSVDKVMKANPENRVAVVGYNSGAGELMKLGRYTPDSSGKYFKHVKNNSATASRGDSIQVVANGASKNSVYCENGTYTQLGIATGYETMMNNSDVAYTFNIDGEERTIQRKPVIILVSDGEPTHCTSHYMDVINNPYYGDGLGAETNNKGIQGYYTILSANYYKRMLGIHYDNPADMYTVAFGMKENDFTQTNGGSATSHYCATVMNPTNTNIDALLQSKTDSKDDVEFMLNKLLRGTFEEKSVSLGGYFKFDNLDFPHSFVPVILENDYQNNYAYADKAYLDNRELNDFSHAFDEIISKSTVLLTTYLYKTQNASPIKIVDPIGECMEIMGEPVLRYNGVNYYPKSTTVSGSRTTYHYSGTVKLHPYSKKTIDLSTIGVVCDKTSDGCQTITMEIPPDSMPIYTVDKTRSFYYEALPIRLIYRVGLSAAGKERVNALQPGEKLTFCTNRYSDDLYANSSLIPSVNNHYYSDNNDWMIKYFKVNNITETFDKSLVVTGTRSEVQHILGNNGKLTFSRPEVTKTKISVEKKWTDYDGRPKTVNLPEYITATLYRTYFNEFGETVREDVIVDFQLTAASNWKITFTGSQLNEVAGREYKYYVKESNSVTGDYTVGYSNDGISGNTPDSPIIITNRYKYGDFELPSTGGPGTTGITAAGLFIVTACLVYGYAMRRKKLGRRRG